MLNGGLLAVLFVGGSILYAVVGCLVARKLIRPHVAEGHNDVLVPLFLTAGVIYAVLLGFMVVGEWESYDAAHANAGEEAALLVPLYRQTIVIDAEKRGEVRKLIREYAEDVVTGWDSFVAGERNRKAGHDTNELLRVFGTIAPDTKAEELVLAQFLQTYSHMVLDRNKRYVQASESLSWIMWLAAIVGGIVTITMSLLLFMERHWPQILAVCVMAGLIGVLLFAIAVLSRPFLGPLAIEPAPFEQSLKVFTDVDQGN